jgi:hypothetical protein
MVKIEALSMLIMAILLCLNSISRYSAFMVLRSILSDSTLINQSNKPVRVRVDFAKPELAKAKYYLGAQFVTYPKIVLIPEKCKIEVKIIPRIKTRIIRW